jgi:hypothetical protein
LKVPGIDGIFVGPNDLSISLGVPDQYDCPKYRDTIKHIIDTSEACGIPVLVHHQTPELSKYWVGQDLALSCTAPTGEPWPRDSGLIFPSYATLPKTFKISLPSPPGPSPLGRGVNET